MARYLDHYRTLFNTLGFTVSIRDAIPASQISRAEQRLGVQLPAALSEYYRVSGSDHPLNTFHNRLFSLEELELDDGHLIFMEENQRVVVWSHVLGSEDPQVDQGVAVKSDRHWYPEEKTVSEFLTFMALFQAGQGALGLVTQVDIDQSTHRFLKSQLTYAADDGEWRIYYQRGMVIWLYSDSNTCCARIATRREHIKKAEKLLGRDLDLKGPA